MPAFYLSPAGRPPPYTNKVDRQQLDEAIAVLSRTVEVEWNDMHTGEKDENGNEILTFSYPLYPPEIFPVLILALFRRLRELTGDDE